MSEQARIKCEAYLITKRRGKTDGVYEVSFDRWKHKYLPLNELKEKSGVKRVNSTKKIEEWLNSEEGYKWAKDVPAANIF